MTLEKDNIWQRAYKIPWNDPDFSRRMLQEHLSQEHDLASRRTEWVDKQVAWIHEHLLEGRPSRILDLGCGPGFYSHRLTALGHQCHGIDFGPASIEYALQHNPDRSLCTFILDDIRRADFGGPYDLAMILFGELNVFSPDEAAIILDKARASLRSGGLLIAETQTSEAVERAGRGDTSEYESQSGLFSDNPHRCRTENRWLPDEKATVQTFTVSEVGGPTRVYHNTTQAWFDPDLIDLLKNAGFRDISPNTSWPCNTPDLQLWTGNKI